MIINILKTCYLNVIMLRSKLSIKKHTKVVFLLSFPSTSQYMLEKLYHHFGNRLVIGYTKNSRALAEVYQQQGCKIYALDSIVTMLKDIVPLVKHAPVVLCDNYFAFLGGIKFPKETKVVQLWHANGAIKNFGLEAKYAQHASDFDKKRYQKVYSRYTHYVVSSDKMAQVFTDSYANNICALNFGYIPTDNYFDPLWMEQTKETFIEVMNKEKKVLLYAPTYREDRSNHFPDLSHVFSVLAKDWHIFVKLHPHDEALYEELAKNEEIILDFQQMELVELLPSVDCLVTDYSSIPFEYSLANPNGKMIFYCYDFEDYQKKVGVQADFLIWVPGEVVYTQEELLKGIQNSTNSNFQRFNKLWNQYNNGCATQALIEWIELNEN